MKRIFIVSNIKYDTDNEDVDLPEELTITIPETMQDSYDEILDFISDQISEITGYCHFGFTTTPEIN